MRSSPVHVKRAAATRRAGIAAIQVARHQLDIEETAYRDMLERVSADYGTAVRSAADLGPTQRQAVLEELRRLGATRAARAHPGKPHNFDSDAMPAMITKIEAMLADMKLPWAYADGIAQQQSGIVKVAWVRDAAQLRGIVAALDVEQEKRHLSALVDERLADRGWSATDMAQRLPPLPLNWRRHRPSLRKALACLDAACRPAMEKGRHD